MANKIDFEITDGDSKAKININETGMVLIQFLWKGNLSKSKKGNLNMAWCSQSMFEKIAEKYFQMIKKEHSNKEEEVPF